MAFIPVASEPSHAVMSFLRPDLDTQLAVARNAFNLGKVPLLVTERTDASRLKPTLNTIEMENMSAIPKCNRQPIIIRGRRICLIFDRWFIERVTADSTLFTAEKQNKRDWRESMPKEYFPRK